MPEQGISTTPDLAQAIKTLEAALRGFARALGTEPGAESPPADGPVFAALRQWRTQQARAKQLPPYVIASDAVLRAIEQAKPKDLQELQTIRGMGAGKVQAYGSEILEVVAKAA